VPYKGTADQMLALAAAIMAGVNSTGFAPWVDQGSCACWLSSARRAAPAGPNVPTMRELGLPQAVYNSPWGLAAPAGHAGVPYRSCTRRSQGHVHPPPHQELAAYDQQARLPEPRATTAAVLATVSAKAGLLARMNLLARPP
jgi:hypothetical protein